LRTLDEGEAMRVNGDFLWSPPGVLTAGTADFEYEVAAEVNWRTAQYLKATGDDLSSPPHTLELRRVDLAGRAVLAQLRCIVLRSDGTGAALVPSLLTPPMDLPIASPIAPGQSWIPGAGDLAFGLVFREPWGNGWRTWRYEQATLDDAWQHLQDWLSFHRWLNPSFAAELADGTEAVRNALRSVGIAPGSPPVNSNNQPDLTESPEATLAKRLCQLVRIGGDLAKFQR
jgi:hypothetical protein